MDMHFKESFEALKFQTSDVCCLSAIPLPYRFCIERKVSKDNIYIIIVYCVDIKQHMSGPQL